MATLSDGTTTLNLGHIATEAPSYITNVTSFTLPGEESNKVETFNLIGGERIFTITGNYTDSDDATFTDPEDWVKQMNDFCDNQAAKITVTFTYTSDRTKASDNTKIFKVAIVKFDHRFLAGQTNNVNYSLTLKESATT